MEEKLRKLILNGDKEKLREIFSKEQSIDKQAIERLIQLSKKKGIKIIEAILLNKIPNGINFYSEKEKENLIVELISEISEGIYTASWYDKIEYELWNWINNENLIPIGINHRIIKEDLKELGEISEKLNLWAIWDKGNNPQAIELAKWKMKFE